MVLAYWGIPQAQEAIAKQLGVRLPIGVPAPQIQRLASRLLTVVYAMGALDTLNKNIQAGIPVIVFLQAGELPHWFGHRFQHAILVVGIDKRSVHILDPAVDEQVIIVPQGDFMLAWDEMDNAYATISLNQ
jgi:ABC-type bacteriocin/lantibiotic exporter with double-glycine peptidase domain